MNILVTGGRGLLGEAIFNNTVEEKLYSNYKFIFVDSSHADLTNMEETKNLFNSMKPDYVIHLAADVGGLYKNMTNKVNMLERNLLINYNVVKCCHDFKVKKLVSCLSTCIFPDNIKYPINETQLHNGPPHHSNNAYAYAKRMLEIHSNAYNEQYNDKFICVIPTNIYGKYDNFSIENGHVIPALIHKCYKAKQMNKPFIVCGSGKPLRQFIYSIDTAKLIMWTLLEYDKLDPIILSVPEKDEVSIEYVATLIAKEFNYENQLKFDWEYPDGQYKKTVDNSKINNYLPDFNFTTIENGIKQTIKWFISNYEEARL